MTVEAGPFTSIKFPLRQETLTFAPKRLNVLRNTAAILRLDIL